MDCPHCGQICEQGALFCGNCGTALPALSEIIHAKGLNRDAVPQEEGSPLAHVWNNHSQLASQAEHDQHYGALAVAGVAELPSYAIPLQGRHHGETKAALSLVFGGLSLVIGVFIYPLAGLILAMTGLILGTLSRHSAKRRLSTIGIVLAVLGILAFVATIAYNVNRHANSTRRVVGANSQPASGVTPSLSTPCYNVVFPGVMKVENSATSCRTSAYNGTSVATSSDAYDIESDTFPALTPVNFTSYAKQILEQGVSQGGQGATITSEVPGTFSGSPAYFVHVTYGTHVASVLVAVLHTSGHGDNLFVIAHALSGNVADISQLESQWQWQ